VRFRAMIRVLPVCLVLISGCIAANSSPAWGQVDIKRKATTKVAPVYPPLARQMNISGVVKVNVTVSASGSVKNAKLVGGHPVLANAALDAVRKWHFEAGPGESTGIVEFRFDPSQ
jgi:TonB family protein